MIRIRTHILCFAGFLLVLGLWGCAGSSRDKTASKSPEVGPPRSGTSGTLLAIVAGRRITSRDVDSVLAAAPATIREEYMTDPEQYKVLLERVVQQEVIYLAAKNSGTENDPGYRAEVANQQRTLLLKHFYQNAARAIPAVPDSAVRSYYETHRSEFDVPGRARVRHIQVATRAKAREVQKQLRSLTWDQVCARASTDKTTAKNGGIVGFVTTDSDAVPGIGKAPAIVAAAFQLKSGETSEPLKSPRGWHIIRVDEKTEAGPRPLAEVDRQIRDTLEGEQSERFQTAWVDSIKRAYGVVVYEDSVRAAMEPVLSPAQLFAQAQAASSPRSRIELFQRVITKYPQDKSAIQAAFMIGFTYAEEMRDFPAARAAFEDFIRKYPSSDLVTSAKWMLENMERSAPPPEVGIPSPKDTLHFETLPAGQKP